MLIFISFKSKLVASCLSDIRMRWSDLVASDAQVRLLKKWRGGLDPSCFDCCKCVACGWLFLRLSCSSVPCWGKVSFVYVSVVIVVLCWYHYCILGCGTHCLQWYRCIMVQKNLCFQVCMCSLLAWRSRVLYLWSVYRMAAFSIDMVGRRNQVRRTLILCVKCQSVSRKSGIGQHIVASVAWPQQDRVGPDCVCTQGIFLLFFLQQWCWLYLCWLAATNPHLCLKLNR